MAGEKTEKATPKRRDEARKKGQVAKSQDLNGSVVLLAGIVALGAVGPTVGEKIGVGMRESLSLVASPDVVAQNTIGALILKVLTPAMLAVAPIMLACALGAIVIGAGQVGIKPMPGAAKPDPKRLNPLTGFKNLFGPNAIVETVKGILKVVIVGVVVLTALLPKVTETAGLVGISPIELSSEMASQVRAIALRAVLIYLLLGIIDYLYQRHRTEKQLRMDKQEVKEEAKGQDLPPEIKSALRRRQMQAARARMMADVPTADVVVTNPTHYAVALRYDRGESAPIVVAKGMDHLAARIRELASDSGVPLVPDPPLARSLHGSVEVGQEIPEELFEAVATVLAHVYRTAAARRHASA